MDTWASDFEAKMKLAVGDHDVSFHYPPLVVENGTRMWHPYTPEGEDYDNTQRAVSYHKWIGSTAKDVWAELDEMDKKTDKFAVIAISNGGAIGFEAALYEQCVGVLFVSSVPVLSQQRRYREVKCPTGFYHGIWDSYYFGGHAAVRSVAEAMDASWFEYDGGHSTFQEHAIADVLRELMTSDRPCSRSPKRQRTQGPVRVVEC